MQSKLTLRIDEHLIRRAKEQAHARGTSVSALVAGYLSALGEPDSNDITPRVQRLLGVLSDSTSSEELYYEHLVKKHE
ncbi:MAG: hypothetical protein K0U79_00525 [Gammaproteobacteria bacterium]|jgi:hypothetical protein|nr:hypothetical protein [Gammaproteobacteria bacterium]